MIIGKENSLRETTGRGEDVEKTEAPLQLLAAMLRSESHAVTYSYFQRGAGDLNIYVNISP